MSDMSEINILGNPDFTEGLDDWHTHGWYEGNTINWISSGGISGSACIELAVPTQLGQSYIYQSVQLLSGTYTAKIHAKRLAEMRMFGFRCTLGNGSIARHYEAKLTRIATPRFLFSLQLMFHVLYRSDI